MIRSSVLRQSKPCPSYRVAHLHRTIASQHSILQYQSPIEKRSYATVSTKKPKLVDLSRELYHRALAHPFHPPVIITPWDTHQPKKAGDTVLRSASYSISFSDHAGTHVDAPKHFDPTPGALSVDQMPLETFYTEAIALDLSHVELKAAITVPEMEEALKKSGQEIKEGDTVLLYMAFNKRIHFDDPRWQVSIHFF
jgi:kynurenine formamidase